MTDHRRFLELAATSVDFPLSPSEQRELDRHLAGCGSCRAELTRVHEDALALASFGASDAPAGLRREIALRARRGPRRSSRTTVLLLAAAFLVILAASQTAAVGGFLRQLLPNNPSEASFPAFPEITEPPSPPTTAASPSAPASSESPGRSESAPSSGSPPTPVEPESGARRARRVRVRSPLRAARRLGADLPAGHSRPD